MDSTRNGNVTDTPSEYGARQSDEEFRGEGRRKEGRRYRERPRRDLSYKSPTLAGFLSMIPGLGQIYVGYYQQGFINAGIVAATIALLASGSLGSLLALFIVFLVFFWFYNIIDAARRAHAYNRHLDGLGADELPEAIALPSSGNPRTWGIVLIVVGLVLFADTKLGFSLAWLEEWWPLIPVGFGVYLLRKGRT